MILVEQLQMFPLLLHLETSEILDQYKSVLKLFLSSIFIMALQRSTILGLYYFKKRWLLEVGNYCQGDGCSNLLSPLSGGRGK